jgi:hypothetical protein
MVDQFADMKDDLDAIFNAPIVAIKETVWFEEKCKKCDGKGKVTIGWTFTRLASCFACGGTGKLTFKTSPEQRARVKASTETRKVKQAENKASQIQAWRDENKAEAAWLDEAAGRGFEFAASLSAALTKFGSLTEKQLAAVRKCAVADGERKVKWAAEKAQATAAAPTVSVEAIEVAFAKAKDSGIRYPRLRLDDFIFTPAPATGKNAGAVYIKSGDQYLGKIIGGKLFATRECTQDASERILAASSDPHKAAVAYGQKFGSCAVCGRELTDGSSIERGIGPICAGKYGW